MNNSLKAAVEQIRAASNSLPNIKREKACKPSVKDVQTLGQLKKATQDEHTGFFGLWSPRSKQFVFGIQEETRAAVGEKAKKRLGKRWKYDFEVRKIKYKHAEQFNSGLRRKEE